VRVRPGWREAGTARLASPGTAAQVAVSIVALEPVGPSTTVARPVLRADLGERDPRPEGLVCYFRDDNGAHVARALVALGERPLVFSRAPIGVPGVELLPPEEGPFVEALRKAPAVVSSAGSNLIAECGALSVPHLALYREDDDEQRLNVLLLKAFRWGEGWAFGELSLGRLEAFLRGAERGREEQGAGGALDAAEAVVACARRLIG
jgi:hypothetical protein